MDAQLLCVQQIFPDDNSSASQNVASFACDKSQTIFSLSISSNVNLPNSVKPFSFLYSLFRAVCVIKASVVSVTCNAYALSPFILLSFCDINLANSDKPCVPSP